jgi:hypothetical protein
MYQMDFFYPVQVYIDLKDGGKGVRGETEQKIFSKKIHQTCYSNDASVRLLRSEMTFGTRTHSQKDLLRHKK